MQILISNAFVTTILNVVAIISAVTARAYG